MIDTEIPYGTGIQIKCPSCGYEGLPNSKKKGLTSLAVILYICGIFPGIIYSIWRKSSCICSCPKCGQVNVKEINGDDELINNLLRLNKIQNYAFVGAILIAVLAIFGLHDYRLRNQEQQPNNSVNTLYQQPNNINPIVKNAQKTTEPAQPTIVEQPKNADDEAREKVAEVVSQIDIKYSNEASYTLASCSGDCKDGIINIEFAKNIGWDYDTIRGQAANRSNKIIKAIPGYFDKIEINYIFNGQNVGHCEFTEYQTNPFTAKGCEYNGYKDTTDEARVKMQNILKEIDKQYSNEAYYVGASCLGDCINGVVNIEFSENIGRWDFTVKSHAAMWNNKIIKAIPGFFDKIRISFIYKGQTVCSCIFTEYQSTATPKGCTYYGYKE